MSLKEFVEKSFAKVGLDYRMHTVYDPFLSRPTDPLIISANPSKAFDKLNWKAKTYGQELVNKLLNEIPTHFGCQS
jgi:GDPmannose 4,6-dehydratase